MHCVISLLSLPDSTRANDLMGKNFVATAVTKTAPANRAIEITLSDGSGNTQKICASADVAQALAQIFGDFARTVQSTSTPPTKLPSTFAVGTGRYEQLVLIRFENDVPYALRVDDAVELGRALLEQAETVSAERPAPVQ
jgi:hypothetical protein